MTQFYVNSNNLLATFKEQNAFKHFGFSDVDIAKFERDLVKVNGTGDHQNPGIAVPCSYLVNKRPHLTTKLLLKYIVEALAELGYSVVCDGFKNINNIHVYDDKVKKCDVVPSPKVQMLNFEREFSFTAKENWDTSSGLATLWFLLLNIRYLIQMDGDETPFLYAKDLVEEGQPIAICRYGKEIHFKLICVWTPKPDDLSDEFIGSLAMVK